MMFCQPRFAVFASAPAPSLCTMDQEALRKLWVTAKSGALSPWQQALAVAYRKASEEIHGGTPNLAWVSSKVVKAGGGHPSREAMRQFFTKVDGDEDWFPGKYSGKKRGPAPLLNSLHCATLFLSVCVP